MATIADKRTLPILLAGMALGTAWAIRGSFGHEQGAAWAGGIGALAIILLAKREDWYHKFLVATLAASAGWGIGGIISYGLVVGFGRGIDFGNVYYGFTMLFFIGGLFGWIGGGLFGLALSDKASNKVQWHTLIVEMIAGGLLFYFFLIREFEWLMTPPRGEEWAACLGMAAAMTWYLFRNDHQAPVRVAFFAAIGAGFGFAFGNFLQVMGQSAAIEGLNLWNVMEYSIGFFGGCGMAYGVFTAEWENVATPVKSSFLVPLLIIAFIIPFIVWDQSFNLAHQESGSGIPVYKQWVALALVFIFFGYSLKKYSLGNIIASKSTGFSHVFIFFCCYLVLYILFHFLNADIFINGLSIEQVGYLLNFAVLLYFIPRIAVSFSRTAINPARWFSMLLIVLIILAILTLIAIFSHGAMPGMQRRFG